MAKGTVEVRIMDHAVMKAVLDGFIELAQRYGDQPEAREVVQRVNEALAKQRAKETGG